MVVAFAGRRIDAANTEKPVFPLAVADSAKTKLVQALRNANATHLISSGACGGDLLAMQAAGILGISKTMILPFNAASFKTTSVIDRPGDWGPVFDKLVAELKQSDTFIELNLEKDDPDVYTKTNFHLLDVAEKIAAETHPENNSPYKQMAMIMWEGKPRETGDTTHHFMLEAKKRKFFIKEILIND